MSEPNDIRASRKAAGLTREQLAQRAGVSTRTLATAEAGGKVSAQSQARIAAVLTDPSLPRRYVPLLPAPVDQPSQARPLQIPPSTRPPDPEPERKTVEVAGKTIVVDNRRYKDLPVLTAQEAWNNVPGVRLALQALENGQFNDAADLAEAMLADDRIKGVVSQRIDGLLGLPFDIPPREEGNDIAELIAKEATQLWPRMVPDDVVRDLWKWGRFLGVGIAEKLYDTQAKEGWVPKLKVWHPRYIWWNWSDRCFMVITQDGPVPVREGDPHWVVYAPYGYYRGWMEALIRALAIPWLFRQFAYRDWGRYDEVHGLPIRAVYMPAQWADADKRRMLREIAALASEGVVRLEQTPDGKGMDLKLIEASAQTYESFKLALDQANDSIAIVILGQNLTTQVKGGAYSAAQVHERVAAAIIRSDSNSLGSTFREQMLIEWVAVNRGPDQADLAPEPSWDTDPPEDKAARAAALLSVAQAVTALRQRSQLPIDYEELCERHDVPLLEGAEVEEYVQPAAPAPFGGQPPGGGEEGGGGEQGDEADPEARKGRMQNMQARVQASALRQAVVSAAISRRDRAPLQGQVYVDRLVEQGRDAAARILAGDVRALRRVIATAKAGPDGNVDGEALKAELLRVYRGMKPDKLARVMANLQLLAKLSGRYAVVKEVISK